MFQIDKRFSKSFKIQKYFLQQNMQVPAGQNSNFAVKLNIKKIAFKLFSCDKNIVFLLNDAATESHVIFPNQQTTEFREKIIQIE